MKKRIIILGSLALFAIVFSHCKKEEISKPQILSHEIGEANSKKAYQGQKLHVDMEILAEGKINQVMLEIHKEDETHEGVTNISWEFDSIYTKFQGQKNITFHEDIIIPLEADTGYYHFLLVVTDMEGYSTSFEEEIKIQNP